jgi:pimeloyl-ACP methyl ester carboxylesterase
MSNGSSGRLPRRRFVQISTLGGAGVLLGCRRGGTADPATAARAVANENLPRITHRQVRTNGIDMHIAEAGTGFPVVFLHGFSELWHSWRHQLPAVAAAGFHAIAPDQRGYGRTDAPPDVESYSMRHLTADVVGLLDALGADKAVLVANNWGSGVAWACAELYPDRVAAMFHLNIAYARRSDEPPTAFIRKFAGDRFNFALYFQQPGIAEAELDKNPRDTLLRFRYALSGDAPPGTVEYLFMKKRADTPMLEGMPNPGRLPAWLTEADLDYQAAEFRRTGFRGGLNWYRNMDRDWRELPKLGATGVVQPVSYIGGRRDPSVIYAPFDQMIAAAPRLRQIVLLEGVGHWIQEERPQEVNKELIEFLRRETAGGQRIHAPERGQ